MGGKLIGNQLVLPLYYSSVTLTSAQLLTLFTTPIQIVPSIPGNWLAPIWGWAEKSAGTGYTIGASTKLGMYYGTSQYMDFAMAGFMDQAAKHTKFSRGPGNNVTGMFGGDLFGTVFDAAGLPLMVTNSVANLTVGTCTLKFTVMYHAISSIPPFS